MNWLAEKPSRSAVSHQLKTLKVPSKLASLSLSLSLILPSHKRQFFSGTKLSQLSAVQQQQCDEVAEYLVLPCKIADIIEKGETASRLLSNFLLYVQLFCSLAEQRVYANFQDHFPGPRPARSPPWGLPTPSTPRPSSGPSGRTRRGTRSSSSRGKTGLPVRVLLGRIPRRRARRGRRFWSWPSPTFFPGWS